MSAPPRRSLRTRLIALCVAIQALMLVLVIGNCLRLAERDLTRLAESRLRQMEDVLAAVLEPPLAAGDTAAAQAALQRLSRQEDVTYLAVLDGTGNVVAAAGALPSPLPEPLAAPGGAPLHHARLMLGSEDLPLADIRYGLSTRFVGDARRDMLMQSAALGGLALFFSTFVLLTMGVVLHARVKALTQANLRLASGDCDIRLEAAGDDEVAALARSFDTMAGAVGDRVAHLEASAGALRASNAELQRLTEITATHLHDPVRSVAECADALAALTDGQLDGDAARCIAAIQAGARRSDGLLRELRNYIAIDMTPLPAAAAADLAQCAEQARQQLAAKIAAAGAEVVIDDLPRAHGDGGQITTALRLLMENAIDHRGEEAPRVRIHASVDSGRVVVGVTDNGPGVPSEFRERIFELFETLDRRTSGAGVGLAAVRKIVRRHLGNVWITPAAGNGLTVNFTLPRLKSLPP